MDRAEAMVRVRIDTLRELKRLAAELGGLTMDDTLQRLFIARDRLIGMQRSSIERRTRPDGSIVGPLGLVAHRRQAQQPLTPAEKAARREAGRGVPLTPEERAELQDIQREIEASGHTPALDRRISDLLGCLPVHTVKGRHKGAKDLKPRTRRRKLPLKVEA